MQTHYNHFALKLRSVDQEPIELDRPRITVGRSSTNLIRLLDKSVSRNHMVIEVFEDHISIQDLNSSAGTFVNSDAVPPFKHLEARLGDALVIGECVCEVVLANAQAVNASESSDGMRTIVW
ncbi:MAG: pSer/pThr/pTyr-binding forkhead associated (FHA) protein [Kiritimatiellia bacterium]|jgi:pSer/pThr/pTyr-binding forkhead associated (FHA) protein